MHGNNAQQQQPQQQKNFTREEVTQLIRQLVLERQEEREENQSGKVLPMAISAALKNTTPAEMRDNIKKYKRNVYRYSDEYWTKSETLNNELVPKLKKANVDTHQVTSIIYKHADNIRIQANGITEIFTNLTNFTYLRERC
jgi:transcriptional regulator NrdR family protein